MGGRQRAGEGLGELASDGRRTQSSSSSSSNAILDTQLWYLLLLLSLKSVALIGRQIFVRGPALVVVDVITWLPASLVCRCGLSCEMTRLHEIHL